MPTIHVYWLKGRSQETREKVATAFIEALASVEGTHVKGPEDVEVWFFDMEPGSIFSHGQALRPAWMKDQNSKDLNF